MNEVFADYDVMYVKSWFADKKQYKPQLQVEYERIGLTILPNRQSALLRKSAHPLSICKKLEYCWESAS